MFGSEEIKELQTRTARMELDSARITREIYDILIPLQEDVQLLKKLTLSAEKYDSLSMLTGDIMVLFGRYPGNHSYELTRFSLRQKIDNYINSRPKGEN